MATAKSVKKTSPGKPVAPAAVTGTAKARTATKAKGPAKPEPVAKTQTRPKAAPKAAPKSPPKTARAKTVRSREKKPATVPEEQRRNYIEVAAYHIAERRGFAPGNPLEDWVQAEAEIDRLIANGLLGG